MPALKMTPNVLGRLFTKYATRLYPVEVREPFPNARGELVNKIEDCIFCGMCQRKCPSQCITVDKKEAVWTLDAFSCVVCGVCVDACPTHCLSQNKAYRSVAVEPVRISLKGEINKKDKKAAAPDDE